MILPERTKKGNFFDADIFIRADDWFPAVMDRSRGNTKDVKSIEQAI